MSGTSATCELCGRTFATEQEKEQHKLLEQEEYRDATVSDKQELEREASL